MILIKIWKQLNLDLNLDLNVNYENNRFMRFWFSG